MDLETARDLLAKALSRAVKEHGTSGPGNRFRCSELNGEFGGPPVFMAGKLGKRYISAINNALKDESFKVSSYANGWFETISKQHIDELRKAVQ